MKVLVTGGLGNLGSWITEHLIKAGFEITTFSSRDREVLRNLDFERVFGEIQNENDVNRLFADKNWDAVIHLASLNEQFLPGYSKKALEINAFGTRNLLQAIADNKQTKPNFIYFSTIHVYGDTSGTVNEDKVFPNPLSDYAATHLFAEYYIKLFHKTHGIPHTIFRLTNSYGCPKELNSGKWYLVLNDLAKMAFEKREIALSSNGKPRRDFIWMGDVCKIVLNCFNSPAANETYNLGGNCSRSILEVADLVRKEFKKKFNQPLEVAINESDLNNYENFQEVSIDKIQEKFGFSPEDKMSEEIRNIFEFLEVSENK